MFNKKIGFIAAIFAAILLPLSVHSAEKNNQAPDAVVKTYYAAMAKCDFATAKKCLATKELQQMISFLEETVKKNPSSKSDVKEEYAPMAAGKFATAKITGNTAKVTVTYTVKKKQKKETHTLKKVDNTWKNED